MLRKFLLSFFTVVTLSSFASAQKTEVTISFNEQFFDALLDAIFQHAGPPEFPLADVRRTNEEATALGILIGSRDQSHQNSDNKPKHSNFNLIPALFAKPGPSSTANSVCKETIRLLRENSGVRSAVRFRDGKIFAPLAFSGNYNPPLIGCVPFAGLAETMIELEFDQNNQRLIARAKVSNVSLNGTGGIGGTIIARMVQSSIDKTINPIEIIRMEKVSFVFPVQNSSSLRMNATGIRHEIRSGLLNVHIAYEFLKAGP